MPTDLHGLIQALTTFSASLTALVLLISCGLLFWDGWRRAGKPEFELSFLYGQLFAVITSISAIAALIPDGFPWPACIFVGLLGGFIVKGGAEKFESYSPIPSPSNDPMKKLNRELRKGVQKFGWDQVVDLAKKVKL